MGEFTMDMRGKTVVITGASRGIGAATAEVFAQAGAHLVLAARSKAALDSLVKKLPSAVAVACDVSKEADVQKMIKVAIESFGRLDVLINNAGVLDPVSRLEDAETAPWDRVIDVNVKGVFYGMRHAVPVMKAQGGGTIITIGSGAATSALEGWSAYCTSKAAVHHLNACLHKEEAEHGIRALIMSPGTVATNMQEVIRASGVNPVSQIPWENHIPAEWVGKVLLWMCGSDADSHLGQTVAIRGEALQELVEGMA
ncbi:MAG: SDR family oxidoreductase [Pseudomonadota bacterium]